MIENDRKSEISIKFYENNYQNELIIKMYRGCSFK